MAGTLHSIRHHVIGFLPLSGSTRTTKLPFSVRVSGFSAKTQGFTTTAMEEGPSCIFVGPIETASQETLEALYRQARDAYYSGEPLIVDDMFDRVELELRWYGSKYVLKYPRCSIRRHSTYADAEFVWLNIELFWIQASNFEFLATVNSILFMGIGSVIGYPLASAAVRVFQILWRNDLVALKGGMPELWGGGLSIRSTSTNITMIRFQLVFAFVKSEKFNDSPHRAECHVCECALEFRAKAEQSVWRIGEKMGVCISSHAEVEVEGRCEHL
ncbi:hypothetical protein PTKIN_Ptkin11bG0028800 [Pterospermum kingtungense]